MKCNYGYTCKLKAWNRHLRISEGFCEKGYEVGREYGNVLLGKLLNDVVDEVHDGQTVSTNAMQTSFDQRHDLSHSPLDKTFVCKAVENHLTGILSVFAGENCEGGEVRPRVNLQLLQHRMEASRDLKTFRLKYE